MLVYAYNYRAIVLGAVGVRNRCSGLSTPNRRSGWVRDRAGRRSRRASGARWRWGDVDSGDAAESSGPAATGSAAGAAFVSVWLMTDNMARQRGPRQGLKLCGTASHIEGALEERSTGDGDAFRQAGGMYHDELFPYGGAAGRHDGAVPGDRVHDRRAGRHDDGAALRGRHQPVRLLELGQDGAADVWRAAGRCRDGAAVLRHDPAAFGAGGPADAQGLYHRERSAQRLRHRPQSGERRRRRDVRPAAPAEPRGSGRRDGA